MPEFAPKRSYRAAYATLLLAGCLSTQGCFFGRGKKTPKVFVPPPVYAKDPTPPAKPVELPTLPETVTTVEAGLEPAVVGTNLPPAPAKPVAPAKTPAAKTPAVAVDVPPVPPTPAISPTTIYSAVERQRMTQDIEQSLGKVRTVLARAEGRNLAPADAALANLARASMLNAEQMRAQDLVTAVSLAKRAESYAMELVQHLP
jgi:hypothetical protein